MISSASLRSLTFFLLTLVVFTCSFINRHEKLFNVEIQTNFQLPKRLNFLTKNQCPIKDVLHKDLSVFYNKNPLINLNRRRYILPYLRNGPNNQLIGLRETIYVAIRLNRTLVLPLFFKHSSDNQTQLTNTISSEHRIDIHEMAQLIPFVTLDQFRQSCNGQIDAVFRTREFEVKDYERFAEVLNVKIPTGDGISGKHDTEYPINQKTERFFMFPPTKQEINKMFGTTALCAFHPYPFRNLRIKEVKPIGPPPTQIDFSSASDEALYSEIIRYTKLPRHVKRMSAEIISAILHDDFYLSLHWRFDHIDWQKRCRQTNIPAARRERCNAVLDLEPDNIAQAIVTKVNDINDVINYVYIASPVAESGFVQEVRNIVENNSHLKVVTYLDVMSLWKTRYESCDWLWRDVNDLLSSTEMEICARSRTFIRSTASTWSGNVLHMRTSDVIPQEYLSHDTDILNLIQTVRKQKNDKKIS